MSLRYRYFFVQVFTFILIVSPLSSAQKKKWTIMIYADGNNANNPLRRQTQCTLTQLLKIAPSQEVAVVSEMRFIIPELGDKGEIQPSENTLCASDGSLEIPLWNGALRFQLDAAAPCRLKKIEFRGLNIDMDSSPELIDFIQWAKAYSPAERYILIIKKHGPDVPYREWSDAFDRLATDFYATDDIFKVFSIDPAKRDIAAYETDEVLNNNTTFAVQFAFPERLNVLAFDSCSRAFIENAFALQNFVDILIASEDDVLLPARWHYDDWIPPLVQHPELSAPELAKLILKRYKKKYAKDTSPEAMKATLSVTDLHTLNSLAAGFDRLVDLFESISVEPQLLQLRPKSYALSNVDFITFLNNVSQRPLVAATPSQVQAQGQFKSSYANLASTFSEAVEAFAGSDAKTENGSLGLTIYFPDCTDDPDMPMFIAGAYNPDRSDALPMVKIHPKWACALRRLLAQQCNQSISTPLQCDINPTH